MNDEEIILESRWKILQGPELKFDSEIVSGKLSAP